MNPLISIIVPVYNAEEYLEDCINSIVKQTYENIEIIVIDNQSSDSSLQIINKFMKVDSRIKLLYCDVQGPSATRNVGIKNAIGEYIMFVDSDDTIEYNSIESIVFKINQYEPNIVLFGFDIIDNNKLVSSVENFTITDGYYFGENYKKIFYNMVMSNRGNYVPSYVYLRAIKKTLLVNNNVYFDELVKRSEDFQFLVKVHSLSNDMYCMYSEKYYHYRIVSTSITHTFTVNYTNMLKRMFIDLYSMTNIDKGVNERLRYRFIIYIIRYIFEISENSRLNYFQKRLLIKKVLDDKMIAKEMKKIKLIDGLNNIGYSFTILKLRNPTLFLLYYRLKRGIL